MKSVVQRVRDASVVVDGEVVGAIDHGLLVYLGVERGDDASLLEPMAGKICRLRIFTDAQDKMNLSVKDVGGKVLVVSQFTLCADLHKGNRPSWDPAAPPQMAEELYEQFLEAMERQGVGVEHGIFGAHMRVTYENDGPVTILLDSDTIGKPRPANG
jgi:D-tyrosyl-tRNA(Tyr) deacylase